MAANIIKIDSQPDHVIFSLKNKPLNITQFSENAEGHFKLYRRNTINQDSDYKKFYKTNVPILQQINYSEKKKMRGQIKL